MTLQRRLRWVPLVLLAAVLNGCAGAGFEVPSYEPREVLVPDECDVLIRRAAEEGIAAMTETESRTVMFCQQQYIIRSLEQEAAARKLEAHAAAARFALQLTTVVIGAVIVFVGWVL